MPALRILGPLRLRGLSGDSALGGTRPRRLLAALALNANEVMSIDSLTEAVWGDFPPRSARENLQTYVWSLRRTLKASGNERIRIQVQPPGYLLRVPLDELDWFCFTRLAAGADTVLREDPATASRLLREALAYWYGPVLADVVSDLSPLWPRIAAMEEARLTALEQRVQADLALGRHRELIGELLELVSAYPLREDFRAHQMVALYRCGRQGDAITAFHQLRAHLSEELGVDPSAGVSRLYEAILQADPQLDAPGPARPGVVGGVPPSAGIPRQLPGQASGFTGRVEPLRELDALLAGGCDTTPILAITGAPGVGKTAFALHWAHRIQGAFPDGTLFADLRGFDPGGVQAEPGEVLDGFLRALAVRPEDIPAAADARAGLFRTKLNTKKALILLDNAASPAQVRPLLPGSPSCLVIITSRSRLSGLVARDGARQIELGPLADREAVTLLRAVVDPRRVADEPEATIEVSRLCGGLPLALRIAANHAATRPFHKLSWVAGQLSDERGRLRVLATDDDDTAVRAAFSWSYRALDAEAARMFRLAGLHPGPEFSVPAAASLIGGTPPHARRMLATLTSAHLIEEAGEDRFRLHDLLAIYAGEQAVADEPESDRRAAVRRVLTWYLHTADTANRVLLPERPRPPFELPSPVSGALTFADYEEAFAWCDTERVNLVTATRQAAALGESGIAWQLPAVLGSYMKLSRRWADWVTTHEIGIEAAGRVREQAAEAWLLSSVAGAHGDLQQFDDAFECLRQALIIQRDLDDQIGQGMVLLNMGFLNWKVRSLDAGTTCFRQALAIFREAGNKYGEAMALNNLGEAYRELGWHAEALDHLRQALMIFQESGDIYNQAMVVDSIGNAQGAMGNLDEALILLAEALELRMQSGDRQGEAFTLDHIAKTHYGKGAHGEARRHWRRALDIFEDLGDPEAARIRGQLDTVAD